jgi:hypothetical protein
MVDGRGFETVNSDNMGDTLRSILTRLAAYVGVVVAAGLLFLAAMSVSDDVAEARGAVRADGSLKKAAPFAMPLPTGRNRQNARGRSVAQRHRRFLPEPLTLASTLRIISANSDCGAD